MKYSSQYHFYTRIAISLLFFALGFFMLQRSVLTTAQVSPADAIEITGWAWNEKVGWISLNCKNDFDGDGELENTCDTVPSDIPYGLEVVNINLGPTTTPHIQGCAWAGNTNEINALEPQVIPSAGWLCFSDLTGVETNAPTNGIPIIQSNWSEQTWTCEVDRGWCTRDYGVTTSTPFCADTGICQLYNPVSPPATPYWCGIDIVRGVCYNYNDIYDFRYPDQLSGLAKEDLIGNYDPTGPVPENWRYCYVDANCANHVTEGEECIYPQVNGRGACTADGVNYSGQVCTYDDECDNAGEYCEIELTLDFIGPELDCTANHDDPNACPTGYSCVASPVENYLAYPNALIYSSSTIGASWLTIANSSAIEGGDLLGFPIASQLANDAFIFNPAYDPDNPDDETGASSGSGPINGCFNCYQEEVKRCSVSNNTCVNDAICNSCNTITYKCLNDNTNNCNIDADCQNTCVAGKCSLATDQDCSSNDDCLPISQCTVRSIINKCDNCLEYFYYQDGQINFCENSYYPQSKTCSDVENDTDCTNGADCKSYPRDKRCEGYDYLYCNNNADCKREDYCNTESPRRCANNSSIICTADTDCPAIYDYSPCVDKEPGTLEKVLAGYQCHGDLEENGVDPTGCTIQDMENSCVLNAYNKNINSCASCDYFFKTPGVILDNHHNRLDKDRIVNGFPEMANLCGWGINSAYDGYNVAGIGWVNFSPAITTSSNPYFSVEQGNIYGQKNILNRYNPPFRKYNASYLIESGGTINNLVSSSTLSETFQGELAYRPFIDFLQTDISGKYKNILGTLDYKGLITSVSVSGNPINKFGGEIVEIVDGADLVSKINDDAMKNKVFYVKAASLVSGSLDIDSDIEFKIGQDLINDKENGAGIIIIEGDLMINANIRYQVSGNGQAPPIIRYLKNIPSAVWIVKGDVILDPSVTDLAGTFVVLGDGNSCATPPQAHCGQFKTGSVDRSDAQLKIVGSVLAKRFYLERLFVDTTPASPTYQEPAEKFINDGRLQANPPLGLVDFSKAVPRFSY